MMFSVAANISIVFLPSLEFATVNEFFFLFEQIKDRLAWENTRGLQLLF